MKHSTIMQRFGLFLLMLIWLLSSVGQCEPWTDQDVCDAVSIMNDDEWQETDKEIIDEDKGLVRYKGVKEDEVMVDLQGRRILKASFFSNRHPDNGLVERPAPVLVSRADGLAKATRIANRFSDYFKKYRMNLRPYDGTAFVWDAEDIDTGVTLPVGIEISLDHTTGKIVYFRSFEYPFRVKKNWNLTREQSITLARQSYPEYSKSSVRVTRFTSWPSGWKTPNDLWLVEFLIYEDRDHAYGPIVHVDDNAEAVRTIVTVGGLPASSIAKSDKSQGKVSSRKNMRQNQIAKPKKSVSPQVVPKKPKKNTKKVQSGYISNSMMIASAMAVVVVIKKYTTAGTS